ncbi:C-C motif chemokine 19-like precursor [Silurus meridionalis]|nr:C-C motif chemokine 19-like precursor [Silurus meridionalis]
MTNAVVALLVFTVLLWNNAQAFPNSAADCCLSTSETLVPRRIAESYLIQTLDSGCPIPATVFITRRNKRLCSPPANNQGFPWVMKLIEYLDNRNNKSKVSLGEQAVDCCLKVSHHPIPKRIVACYREQRKGEGCLISAVVFRTRKGRELCAPHDVDWVADVMNAVDARPMNKNRVYNFI